MTVTEELNELFSKWKSSNYEIFCEDGITDEKYFTGTKILFILKDAHIIDKNSEGNKSNTIDMRKEVCKEGEGNTWNSIALWSKALLDKDNKSFEQVSEEIKNRLELREKYLSKIAFMNIKKEAGGPNVSRKVLLDFSKKDKDYIMKEISIINPDIIIACGSDVFTALQKNVFGNCEINEEKTITFDGVTENYVQVFEISNMIRKNMNNFEKPVYVVKYRHPNRSNYEACFNDMLKIKKSFLP